MSKKRNILYLFLFFAFVLLLGLILLPQPNAINLEDGDGHYDLLGENVDFDDTIYRISASSWESWPEKLYTPQDFSSGNGLEAPQFLDASVYKNLTHATHRLIVKLPPGKTYGISMLSSEYAMRMYVDGTELSRIGMPGETRAETEHRALECTYYFTAQGDKTEIIVQAANFVHAKGGAWPPQIDLGTADNITRWDTVNTSVSFLIVGFLLMAFLYHIGLFCLNRSRKIVLLFSFCCLLLALLNKKLILLFWLDYDWFVGIRIEYWIHYLSFALLVLLIEKLHPKLLHRYVTRAYYIIAAVYALATLLLDSLIFTGLLVYFDILSMMLIVYILVQLARSLQSGIIQNYLSFSGVLALGLLGINDVLYYRGIVIIPPIAGQFYMAPIGMIFFVFCFALRLSIEYDETERAAREAHEKNVVLDRMDRLKTELMTTISHESRTPLAVLSSYAGLVSMELKDKGVDIQMAKDLDKIAFEAKRVSNLIDGMRDLAMYNLEQAKRVPMDLGEMINQTARLYLPILSRKGVTLEIRIEENLPQVFGNPAELTQVVFNLLQNARNYTEQGNVMVSVAREFDSIVLYVCDTGIGISPELLPHVLERGVRGSEGGTGIGLAVCKEIIQAHGGEIFVESVWKKGTTITLHLPVYDKEEA